MRGIGAFVGGALFIAAIFGGWWLFDRAQEHLPGPVNAVIDSVQNGGLPAAGPIVAPLATDSGESEQRVSAERCGAGMTHLSTSVRVAYAD